VRAKHIETPGRRAPPAAIAAPQPGSGGAVAAAAAAGIGALSGLVATTKLLELAHGLYGVSLGEVKGDRRELAGLEMPATHVTCFPGGGFDGVELIAASAGPAGWIGPAGGTVAVKIPSERGRILITTYRLADQEAVPLEIQIVRIDRSVQRAPPSTTAAETASAKARQDDAGAPVEPAARDLEVEIVLHIDGLGDRRFSGGEWSGSQGQGRSIGAFSVRPLHKLAATDIEYKGFGPGGRETPWVTAAVLCGTRDRGISLTGFAIRLVGQPSEQFDIVYEGAFAQSGIAGPCRNGAPCRPSKADDSLEAVRIRLREWAATKAAGSIGP
jgi:hypothetical protein